MKAPGLVGVSFVVGCLWLSWSHVAGAQSTPYDPYAAPEEEASAGAEKQKPRWPPFYKPIEVDAKHAFYYAMGFCRWNPSNYQIKPSDIVDVNKLSETTRIVTANDVGKGYITGFDERGQGITILMHPKAGASQLHITGKSSTKALRRGVYVRLSADLDESLNSRTPVAKFTLITPAKDFEFRAPSAQSKAPIVARVVAQENRRLKLLIKTDKDYRFAVEFVEDAAVDVDADDPALVDVGDAVTAKGHLYTNEKHPEVSVIFADGLEVTLGHALHGGKRNAPRVAGN